MLYFFYIEMNIEVVYRVVWMYLVFNIICVCLGIWRFKILSVYFELFGFVIEFEVFGVIIVLLCEWYFFKSEYSIYLNLILFSFVFWFFFFDVGFFCMYC